MLARNTQIQNEKHMYTLIRMEKEHMQQDVRNMKTKLTKFDNKKNYKLSNIKSMMAKLEKLKLSVKWDENVIDILEDAIAKKDEDNEVIVKYSKEDRRRVEELEMKRKRLREEELARRQLVIRTANEIDCLELTLGRNGQIYKQMCEEQNSLVQRWKEAVNCLQQRNRDTIGVVIEINTVQDAIKSNREVLEEQKVFVANEKANNLEMELKISEQNAEVARLRLRLNKIIVTVKDRAIDTTGLQRELQQTATALESVRAEKRKLIAQQLEEKINVENAMANTVRLKEKLVEVRQSNMSAEERLRKLEDMISVEEAMSKNLIYDIERIQGILFRSQSSQTDYIDAFKLVEMANRIEEQNINTVVRQIAQVQAEERLSHEIIYKLNFRVNMLDNRIGKATGEHHDDNIEEYQLRIRELDKIMQLVNETGTLLQLQITRLEDDMRRLSMSTSNDAEALRILQDHIHEKKLMVEGAIKLVGQKRANNNLLRVQLNVLAVRLRAAEKLLKHEGGIIYGLQRQKMELEEIVQERQAELGVERDLLATKRRSLQDDNCRLQGDLQLRQIKEEQLKKKLDYILSTLGRSETGETVSVTYFRVKNAQEKYALQQEGDRLDALIRKTEHEIIAMENTLRVVNTTNDAYRKSLDILEDDAEEIKELKNLEEQLKDLSSETRKQGNELEERGHILRSIKKSMEEIRGRCSETATTLNELEQILNDILKEEAERKVKLDRAAAAAVTKDCTCDDRYKDMTVKQLKQINDSSVLQLDAVAMKYIETKPPIHRYCKEYKILLPKRSITAVRSRHDTARSKSSLSAKSDSSSGSSVPAVFLTLNIP